MTDIRLKSIAFPKEHGSWGLLFEPLTVSLFISPTLVSALIGLGMCFLFLFYNPFRMLVLDRIQKVKLPHERWTVTFSVVYGVLGALSFGSAFWLSRSHGYLLILLLALLCFLIQFLFAIRRSSRSFLAEALGALGLCASAPMILLAAGEPIQVFAGVWILLGLRAMGSLVYVRNKLRAHQKKPYSSRAVFIYQAAAVFFLFVLAVRSFIPWLAVAGYLILAVHCLQGILNVMVSLSPKKVGIRELILGTAYAGIVILAYV